MHRKDTTQTPFQLGTIEFTSGSLVTINPRYAPASRVKIRVTDVSTALDFHEGDNVLFSGNEHQGEVIAISPRQRDELEQAERGIQEATKSIRRRYSEVEKKLSDTEEEIRSAEKNLKRIKQERDKQREKLERDIEREYNEKRAAEERKLSQIKEELREEREKIKRLQKVVRYADTSNQRDKVPYSTNEEPWVLNYIIERLLQKAAPSTILALHLSLKHAPFLVMAGASGIGKTSLIRNYATLMGMNLTMVPVQPAWSSVQDLHGYMNPLKPGQYQSTRFMDALSRQRTWEIQAASSSNPYEYPLDLVLLDEINLAHVEYFLSDYLSSFETAEREINILSPEETESLLETSPLHWLKSTRGCVRIPRTFLIAGTANEDHTTQGFSDKFRDRAAFLHPATPSFSLEALYSSDDLSGTHYVSSLTWNTWISDGEQFKHEKTTSRNQPFHNQPFHNQLVRFAQHLQENDLPVSLRLFRRTVLIYQDALRLSKLLDHPLADEDLLDIALSLGIAHKYAQLTEESPEKRSLLIESLGSVFFDSDIISPDIAPMTYRSFYREQ